MQVWAFACAARKFLHKAPAMNIVNFDKEVWILHRRLHHRFIKFAEYVKQATEGLDAYIEAQEAEKKTGSRVRGDKGEAAAAGTTADNAVCLMTSSSESDDD